MNIQMIATEQLQDGSNFWFCGLNVKLWLFKWKIWSSTSLWYHMHVFYTYFSVFEWNYIMWLFKQELLGSTFVCTCVLQYFTKWKSWEIFLNLDLRYSRLKSNSFLVLFSNWLIYYSSLEGVCQVQASLGMGTQ